MSSYYPKKNELTRKWFLVDASDEVLGRLSTEVAMRLMGKRSPRYTPSADVGDHIVVINAEKVRLTGRKLEQKQYIHHTGYPRGLRQELARDYKQRVPERVVYDAVRGMLPKTKLGRAMLRKLRVYAGPEHRHAAQQPQALSLKRQAPAAGQ